MVHVGYDNFVSLSQGWTDGQAHQANERGCIHAKRNFAYVTRVDQLSDTLTSTEDGLVHFTAFGVASAALDIALEQVMIYRIQHHLRYLRTRRVVEKREMRRAT